MTLRCTLPGGTHLIYVVPLLVSDNQCRLKLVDTTGFRKRVTSLKLPNQWTYSSFLRSEVSSPDPRFFHVHPRRTGLSPNTSGPQSGQSKVLGGRPDLNGHQRGLLRVFPGQGLFLQRHLYLRESHPVTRRQTSTPERFDAARSWSRGSSCVPSCPSHASFWGL